MLSQVFFLVAVIKMQTTDSTIKIIVTVYKKSEFFPCDVSGFAVSRHYVREGGLVVLSLHPLESI